MSTYQGHNEDASGNILLSIGNGMTAVVETGTTASQAYTVGEYLFFNNRLCKVSTAIASGDTLEVGTNVSTTSVGAELTDHLVASDGTEFYFDVYDGEYGYYPSASKTASEFVPFGGTTIQLLAENEYSGSFDVSSLLSNYSSLTADNFLVVPTSIYSRYFKVVSTGQWTDTGYAYFGGVTGYNASTGILTYNRSHGLQIANVGYGFTDCYVSIYYIN